MGEKIDSANIGREYDDQTRFSVRTNPPLGTTDE